MEEQEQVELIEQLERAAGRQRHYTKSLLLALGVLLAFGAKGTPAVVMSIVFAGAPVVNALYALVTHPPAGGWGAVKPLFWVGILLAALGGTLVTFYKPAPPAPQKAAVTAPAEPQPPGK